VKGKTLFIGKGTCGGCHTLARAGSKGTTGPNLDDAFADARSVGMTDNTIKGVVRDQISHVRRGSVMPNNLLKGADAIDVAAYVGSVAAKSGQDVGALANVGGGWRQRPAGTREGRHDHNPRDPTGALSFVTRKATGTPGKVTISMPNKSPIQHNIARQGGHHRSGPDRPVPAATRSSPSP